MMGLASSLTVVCTITAIYYIESKRAEISQVVDGEKYNSDINQSIINDLIKIIKEKHKKI